MSDAPRRAVAAQAGHRRDPRPEGPRWPTAERRAARADRRRRHGLRFPGGADDPESFWRLLWDGVDAIARGAAPSAGRSTTLYDPDPDAPGKMATRCGGFLDRRRPVRRRVLRHLAARGREHGPAAAAAARGGVGGARARRHRRRRPGRHATPASSSASATATTCACCWPTASRSTPTRRPATRSSVAAGRLSYVLGAAGPGRRRSTPPARRRSSPCTSPCRACAAGECDLALAGGVNLILTPELTINFSRARMMAADGRCKTFDAAADGYVRAEGCGMVVLKRLSATPQADGDRVLAVDPRLGRQPGRPQRRPHRAERPGAGAGRSRAALADAGVDAGRRRLRRGPRHRHAARRPDRGAAPSAPCCAATARPTEPLLLGSVKTNIGHIEAAAGVAGLIKVVLMLQHGAVPPHLHLAELNPHIAADGLPDRRARPTPTPWPAARRRPRSAGVSSFGLSGTNAHVVVAEAPPVPAPDGAGRPSGRRTSSTLSARSRGGAAGSWPARYAAHLADASRAVAGRRRLQRQHRAGPPRPPRWPSWPPTPPTRSERLAGDRRRGRRTPAWSPAAPGSAAPTVAFLFTGHGSHYAGMGRAAVRDAARLPRRHRPLRRRCSRGELDRPLPEILFGAGGLLDQMAYAQPALFALQYALAELWRSWGVRAVGRGRPQRRRVRGRRRRRRARPRGRPAADRRPRPADADADRPTARWSALFVDEADGGRRRRRRRGDGVGIAAVNGPTTTVISGRRDAVQRRARRPRPRRRRLPPPRHLRRRPLAARRADPRRVRGASCAGVALSPPQIAPRVEHDRRARRRRAHHGRRTGAATSASRCASPPSFDTLRAAGVRHLRRDRSPPHAARPRPALLARRRRRRGRRRCAATRDELASRCSRRWPRSTPPACAVDWAAVDRPYRAGAGWRCPTYPWQRESYWSPARPAARAAAAAPAWPAAAARGRGPGRRRARSTSASRPTPSAGRVLDRLAVGAHRRRRCASSACSPPPASAIASTSWSPAVASRAGYEHLVARWLGHLADDGLLRRDGDGASSPSSRCPTADLDGAAGRGRGGVRRRSSRCSTTSPLRRRSWPPSSPARRAPLATLFPDGSYETVDFLYSAWAVARYFNGIVARRGRGGGRRPAGRSRCGSSRSAPAPAARRRPCCPALPRRPHQLHVHRRLRLLPGARRRALRRPPVRALRRCSTSSGRRPSRAIAPGAYDVVIAANVLHATRDLDADARSTSASLLAPGGAARRLRGHRPPALVRRHDRPDRGLAALRGRAGATTTRCSTPSGGPRRWPPPASPRSLALPRRRRSRPAILGQHVLLARAPGERRARAARVDVVDAGRRRAPPCADGVLPAPDDVGAGAGRRARPTSASSVLVDVVRRAVAHVLRIADPDAPAARPAAARPRLRLADGRRAAQRAAPGRSASTASCRPRWCSTTRTIAAIATYLEQRPAGRRRGSTATDDADVADAPPPMAPSSADGRSPSPSCPTTRSRRCC